MSEIELKALAEKLSANALAYEMLGEKQLPALLREAAEVIARSSGYMEQHRRDSQELRKLCESRDVARRERNGAITSANYMRAVLTKIAGYRMSEFAGPHDMAAACVFDAENALPAPPEVVG